MGRNIDFFAVLLIALTMLGFAELRSWHLRETLDSIRVEHAIDIQRCPITPQVLSGLASVFR